MGACAGFMDFRGAGGGVGSGMIATLNVLLIYFNQWFSHNDGKPENWIHSLRLLCFFKLR